jgi:hypothetical protein
MLRFHERANVAASVAPGGVIDDEDAYANQAWGLDPVGNPLGGPKGWSGFKSSGATTQPWDLDQARVHNKANEIADSGETPNAISGTPNWIDPAYDLAGNMTAGPQPRYETVDANTQWYKYDAWNRLVRLGQGAGSPGALVATYSYDGQNRRIRKVVAATPSNITYDYYYNESWQVLEVRKGESQNAYEQYVWGIHNGKGLIYAPPHYLRIQCSSISSSDRPLVSGTQPQTSTMVTRQKKAYTKNGKPWLKLSTRNLFSSIMGNVWETM